MIHLELQKHSSSSLIPPLADLEIWAKAAIRRDAAELVIRVVDEDESAELNEHYRHKLGPTNVLSFPFETPPGIQTDTIGDLVVCAPIVEREALAQGKSLQAHWAHMVVHGILHLQGYDHIEEGEALVMEAEEVEVLKLLGFTNPYAEVQPL